jgi:hypothetical protein
MAEGVLPGVSMLSRAFPLFLLSTLAFGSGCPDRVAFEPFLAPFDAAERERFDLLWAAKEGNLSVVVTRGEEPGLRFRAAGEDRLGRRTVGRDARILAPRAVELSDPRRALSRQATISSTITCWSEKRRRSLSR